MFKVSFWIGMVWAVIAYALYVRKLVLARTTQEIETLSPMNECLYAVQWAPYVFFIGGILIAKVGFLASVGGSEIFPVLYGDRLNSLNAHAGYAWAGLGVNALLVLLSFATYSGVKDENQTKYQKNDLALEYATGKLTQESLKKLSVDCKVPPHLVGIVYKQVGDSIVNSSYLSSAVSLVQTVAAEQAKVMANVLRLSSISQETREVLETVIMERAMSLSDNLTALTLADSVSEFLKELAETLREGEAERMVGRLSAPGLELRKLIVSEVQKNLKETAEYAKIKEQAEVAERKKIAVDYAKRGRNLIHRNNKGNTK